MILDKYIKYDILIMGGTNMKYISHPLLRVIPTYDYHLICQFKNGKVKIFDFNKVMERYPQFEKLKEDNLFFAAKVDLGGLCVTFNEDLDISEESLYQHGIPYDYKKENKKLTKDIYAYCKYIRKKEGITQKQLSNMTQIPQSGLARIESGHSNVSLSTLSAYLDPLGYKIEIVKRGC